MNFCERDGRQQINAGNPPVGQVLRQLRVTRGLTLAAAARQVRCATSLLAQIETGSRRLRPALAASLDRLYGTGGAVTALATASIQPGTSGNAWGHDDGMVMVLIPGRGISVPVSRREVLAAVGIGAAGSLLPGLRRAVEPVTVDEHVLAELEATLAGLTAAGRVAAPASLIDPLTAQVALIEALRQQAPRALRVRCTLLQARFAEALAWMAEEAGQLPTALYWLDRAGHSAQLASWPAMAGYTAVRRAMLALTYTNDTAAAIEQAQPALRLPGVPARVRALAHKQIAYGHALAGRADAARYALDQSAELLHETGAPQPHRPQPGQNSVTDDHLLAIFEATCDVYLGGSDRVIEILTPRMNSISTGSARTAAITTAKLARAYVYVGDPSHACRLILDSLEVSTTLDSLTTLSELRRAVPQLVLRWPGRSDVREVQYRLSR